MKVEKSVSMHWHAFERPCKRQILTDTKSRNTSHIFYYYLNEKYHVKRNMNSEKGSVYIGN